MIYLNNNDIIKLWNTLIYVAIYNLYYVNIFTIQLI